MTDTMPVITLQIERLKEKIVHQLVIHHEELERIIEKEINTCLTSEQFYRSVQYKVQQVIREEVDIAIERNVKNAFEKANDGINKLFNNVVDKIVEETLKGK